MKECSRCLEDKPLSEFYKSPVNKDGLDYRCKQCCNALAKKNTARLKQEDPEKYKAYKRHSNLNYRLKKLGITKAQYWAKSKEQNGLCPICEKPLPDIPYIDHNHKTNKIRGLLCMKCNVALGHFQDSPEIIAEAIKYLEFWKAKHQEL